MKIFHVLGALSGGGAEIWCKNFVINAQKRGVHSYGIISLTSKGNILEEEMVRCGIVIHYLESRNPVQVFLRLRKIQKTEHIDVIHSHIHLFSGFLVLIAAMIGIKNRIVHSHTSNDPRNQLYVKVMRLLILLFSTGGIAVSRSAYRDLFLIRRNNLIMHCGIPLPDLNYENKKSSKVITIGTIARLESVKNQKLLLDIARYMINSHHIRLVIVGDGSLRQDLETYADEIGIRDSVFFAGWTSNVYKYLSTMDCFIMTSFREGLPLSAIEAQAAGVPVVLANTISDEAIVFPQISGFQVALDAPLSDWQDTILKTVATSFDRTRVYKTDFNLDTNITALESFYLEIRRS